MALPLNGCPYVGVAKHCMPSIRATRVYFPPAAKPVEEDVEATKTAKTSRRSLLKKPVEEDY